MQSYLKVGVLLNFYHYQMLSIDIIGLKYLLIRLLVKPIFSIWLASFIELVYL